MLAFPLMALALGAPASALAQAAAAPAGDDDIIVTAQKREQRLVDVPISITAVSGERLQDSGVKRSYDLAQTVPGLRIDEDGGNVQPTVRGIGNQIAGPGVSPAVATYIDGFYQTGLQGLTFDFIGVESVQVLKGPQGTLFGRNATGGAIVVTTKNPSQIPEFEGLLGYGRFNEVRAQVYGSAPLNDKLAMNVAVSYRRSDGFVKNVLTGRDAASLERWTVRGKLRWEPTDTFSAQLQVEHTDSDDGSALAYNSYKGLNNVAALLPVFGASPPPEGVVAPTKRGQVANEYPNRFYGKDSKVYLTLENEFPGFATLRSFTQYQKENYTYQIDFDATNANVYGAVQPTPIKTFSEEINLISEKSDKLDWVLGAYYFWSDAVNAPYHQHGIIIDGTGQVTTNAFYTRVKTESFAVFADATYNITDALHLTLGGRYSWEKSESQAQQNPDGIPTTVPAAFGGGSPPGPFLTGSQKFKAFTPRAVLRYELAQDSNVYASYSRGFKGGGFAPTNFTATPGAIPQFNPEYVDAFELGYKGIFGSTRLELSAYYNKYKGQQVAFYTAGVGTIRNAANSRIYGVEAQFSTKLTDQFTVGANAAYTNGRYQSFPLASRSLITGNVNFPADGLRMSRVPDWTGNIYGTYTVPVGDGSVSATASLYGTSKVPLDPTNFYVQKGYAILNGKITYALPGDNIKISVYGDNITSTTYTASILPFPPFAILQQYGAPVTYGAEVSFKF